MELIGSSTANVYTDTLLDNLHIEMIDRGLNNISLPETCSEFCKKSMGINWNTELFFFNGLLKGIETIHRTGDSYVSIDTTGLIVDVQVGIVNTELDYDVNVKMMNHGPIHGTIHGCISYITSNIQLNINPMSDLMLLDKFEIKEVGELTTRITGLGAILNFFVSHVIQIVGNRLKYKLSSVMQDVVKDLLNESINKIPFYSSQENSENFNFKKKFYAS